MRRLVLAIAVATSIGGGVVAGSASADDAEGRHRPDPVVIDRVDVRPSILPGLVRVRALVSATQLRGQRIEAPGARLAVKLPGMKPAFVTGYFANAEVELALVILVPTTLEFEPELETIKEHVATKLLGPLKGLGARVRVQIIGYGGGFSGSKGLVSLDSGRKALANLSSDGSGDPPDVLEAVKRALKSATAGARSPKAKGALARAAVVMISSGLTITPDTEELKAKLTRLGEDADAAGVRIHTLGYVPALDGELRPRRPLLALGELSRRSHGVFRWIQTSAGWDAAFAQLTEQLALQYVVTFFASADELAGKKLTVAVPLGEDVLESRAAKLGEPKCGKDRCDANAYCAQDVCVARLRQSGIGAGGWAALLGGGAAAALGAVGLIVAIKRRRARAAVAGPHPVGAPPAGGGAAPRPSPPVATTAAAPPATPVLLVLTGPRAGMRLPLRHGFAIGKAPGCDLDLSHDNFASTHHAQIGWDRGAWMVFDRGSTNGTFANGVRISEARLDHGMTIRFGSTDVRFWIGE